MLRRGFWLAVGAGVGVWAVLKVQQTTARLTPSGVVDGAVRHVRHLGNDLAAALAEGQRTKRLTEAELRQAVPARSPIDVVEHRGLPALGVVDTRA
jgi:hypothetical protein